MERKVTAYLPLDVKQVLEGKADLWRTKKALEGVGLFLQIEQNRQESEEREREIPENSSSPQREHWIYDRVG